MAAQLERRHLCIAQSCMEAMIGGCPSDRRHPMLLASPASLAEPVLRRVECQPRACDSGGCSHGTRRATTANRGSAVISPYA